MVISLRYEKRLIDHELEDAFARRHIRKIIQAVISTRITAITTGTTIEIIETRVDVRSSARLKGIFPAPAVVAVTIGRMATALILSLIHISEPTRLGMISY